MPLARIYENCFKPLIINVLTAKSLTHTKGTSVQLFALIFDFWYTKTAPGEHDAHRGRLKIWRVMIKF